MRIELTNEQQKVLNAIIANTNIKGADALTIVELVNAINNPVKDKSCNKKSETPLMDTEPSLDSLPQS